MKKNILFLLLSIMISEINAEKILLENMRVLYQKSFTDKSSCIQMYEDLEKIKLTENTVLYGYKAVSKMMMANYVKNPFSKLSYFKEGKKMLENAIKKDNSNIELRFLRLCVQENAPSLLGYNSDIAADKKYIQLAFTTIKDIQLKTLIKNYLN